jgi:hypothetical protein
MANMAWRTAATSKLAMAQARKRASESERRAAMRGNAATGLPRLISLATCSPLLRSAIWIANSGVGSIIVGPTPSAGHEITAKMGRKTKTKAAKKKNEKAKAAKAAAGEFVSVRGRAAVLDLCPGTLASCRCGGWPGRCCSCCRAGPSACAFLRRWGLNALVSGPGFGGVRHTIVSGGRHFSLN